MVVLAFCCSLAIGTWASEFEADAAFRHRPSRRAINRGFPVSSNPIVISERQTCEKDAMCAEHSHSDPQLADERIQRLCDRVKGALEARFKHGFTEYRAINYKTQVVAGVNYFVKIKIGPTEYVHAKICDPHPKFGDSPQLEGLQRQRTAEDRIDFY